MTESDFVKAEDMETIRQRIMECLINGPMTARDLSQSLGIREKEVYEHLGHIVRSVEAQGKTLRIHPAECLQCGFVFKGRKRYTKPGRCPQCKKTHVQWPAYEIS